MPKNGLHEAAMDATVDLQAGPEALARDHPEWAGQKDDVRGHNRLHTPRHNIFDTRLFL